MHRIVGISVFRMTETNDRTSYYVRVTTDEGMTKEVACHRTPSRHDTFPGLTVERARDQALIDAHTWSDFLAIPVDPYVEDGVVHEPSMTFETYTSERMLDARRAARKVTAAA